MKIKIEIVTIDGTAYRFEGESENDLDDYRLSAQLKDFFKQMNKLNII